MRLILGAWVLAVTAVTGATAQSQPSIQYSLSPVVDSNGLTALNIQIRLDGEEDGDTVLNLPNEWGGKTKLYESIRDLKIAGGDVVSQKDPAVRIVQHRPKAKLFISYKIVQNWPGPPKATGQNEYRPIIQKNYFHVLGNAIFISPERDDKPQASFSYSGAPSGWSFASDLEHATVLRPLVLDEILESVLVGGDFRVLTNGKVRLALRGKWSFSDQSLVDRLGPIVESHHRFWGDAGEPFLVTAIPLAGEQGAMSLGGTGRGDAFAFFATDNAESSTLNRLLAHEHLHTWIPRRIGSMPKQDEAKDYWLSEGFTDFYTGRLLLRDRVWTLKEEVDWINQALNDYAYLSVKTAPNSKIVTDFWKDPDVQRLPYLRGHLLGHLWDHELRQDSEGERNLDAVVLAMRARVRDLGEQQEPPLASQLFAEEAKKLGLDVGPAMNKIVREGGAILLPKEIFSPCGNVETSNIAEFDRGFDPDKTAENNNVIVGLKENGNGYRAGLRNGMKIIKREGGKNGDSRVPISYRVQDGSGERVISYLPEGSKRVTLQELVLAEDMSEKERKNCVARLSGMPGWFNSGIWSKLKSWMPF
jgi:predicted metalloprotease with PDZ domain